jgi:peptidoglycan/LPS O-acetylase OafA/YrhL
MIESAEAVSAPVNLVGARDSSPQANNFNFMRLCLASLVILSHSFELLDGNRHREILTRIFHTLSFGEFAVDGFFILSGYLITKSWQQRPVLVTYLKKRVFRIYPGFVVAALVCLFIVGPLGSHYSQAFSNIRPLKCLLAIVMLKVPETPSAFAGLPYPFVNGSTWTIPYEFKCYIAVALFGLIGATKNRRLWLAIAFCFLATSLIHRETIDRLPFYGLGEPFMFFRLFSFFTAGGVFHLYRDKIKYNTPLLLVASVITTAGMFQAQAAQFVLATFGAYVFFGIGFKHFRGLEWHRSWPDISYGVYLYGWPSTMLLIWYFRGINPYELFFCSLASAAACGWLSWHLVESPFMMIKARLGRPEKAATS